MAASTVVARPKVEKSARPQVSVSAEPAVDLRVRGLSKSFARRGKVLSDISITVEHGQAVALIGANGSGKSTLLRSCLRLIEPDDGEVHLLGEPVHKLSKKLLRRLRSRVGLVFQRHNLVPRSTVLTNVIHGVFARTWSPRIWCHTFAHAKYREEAMSCLEQVGLSHLALSRTDELSGGESQRVAIARALMQRPRIIMADEPVASLDPKVGEEVMELFYNLIHKQDLTFVYVSHDLEHALDYSDKVIGLNRGEVVLDSPSHELHKTRLRNIYD